MGWSCLGGANQVAHLRVHRANGIDVHQIHIEQSTKEQKQFILEYLPNQTAKSLAKAVGSNLETLETSPPHFKGGFQILCSIVAQDSEYNIRFLTILNSASSKGT